MNSSYTDTIIKPYQQTRKRKSPCRNTPESHIDQFYMEGDECHSAEEVNTNLNYCVVCKRTFSTKKSQELHVCHGGKQRNDLITASIRYSCEMIDK